MPDYESTDKMDWFIRKMSSGWFSRKEILALAATEFPTTSRKKLDGTIGQYWSDSVNSKWPTYKAIQEQGLSVVTEVGGRRHIASESEVPSLPSARNKTFSPKNLPRHPVKFSTQWAAQFLAASELTRRGYEVTFTMGNTTPVADLVVGSPTTGKLFWVDVKGLASKTAWLVSPKSERPELYYVLVYLAPLAKALNARQTDMFFILTQGEVNSLLHDYANRHPGDKGKMPGFGFKDPQHFEGAWEKLPF